LHSLRLCAFAFAGSCEADESEHLPSNIKVRGCLKGFRSEAVLFFFPLC